MTAIRLSPIIGRDLADLVTIVVRGVVDQNLDAAAQRGLERRHGAREIAEVGEVARFEHRAVRHVGHELLDQRARRILCDVHEADLRALRDERLDQRRTDAASAAGHQHALVAQAGIGGATSGAEGRGARGFSVQHGYLDIEEGGAGAVNAPSRAGPAAPGWSSDRRCPSTTAPPPWRW